MNVCEVKPAIRQFELRQEKDVDKDYGSCLWATIYVDTESYQLTINSDCGSYVYSWHPTPETESFEELLGRMDKGYLLDKMADMEFDFKGCVDATIKVIEDYFSSKEEDEEYESEEEKLEQKTMKDDIIQGLKKMFAVNNPYDFRYECSELMIKFGFEDDDFDCDYRIVSDAMKYPACAERVIRLFVEYIQPILKKDGRKIRNIRIAKKNNFPLKKIQDIRKGDKFVNYNGKIVTAAYDASYNSDENCWVVYDESGESYFEDDFNM